MLFTYDDFRGWRNVISGVCQLFSSKERVRGDPVRFDSNPEMLQSIKNYISDTWFFLTAPFIFRGWNEPPKFNAFFVDAVREWVRNNLQNVNFSWHLYTIFKRMHRKKQWNIWIIRVSGLPVAHSYRTISYKVFDFFPLRPWVAFLDVKATH